jgi:hypothetical protein
MGLTLIGGKIFQKLDGDPYRGAIDIEKREFNEGYPVPFYLDQGWKNASSL